VRASLIPPGFLHTGGAHITANDGAVVRLAGVNWYGIEGDWMVPGGLDVRTIDDICELIVTLGFNHIRLPFSDTAVLRNPTIRSGLAAMPALAGACVLDVIDAVIEGARRCRLRVVLDSHRSDPGWSAQGNGLWYSRTVSRRAWRRALLTLAQRYAGDDTVIGFDLRNEPGSPPTDPGEWPRNGGAVWGERDRPLTLHPRDWAAAAEAAGNALLAVNPRLLVIVEGVRYDPAGPQFGGSNRLYWPGGNLSGVDRAAGRRRHGRPIVLDSLGRLVYSAHDYGPDMDQAMPWCREGTTALTPDACRSVWEQTWGSIARRAIAPVYVGEFGTPNGLWPPSGSARRDYTDARATDPQTRWLRYLVDYIDDVGASWAYWPLNGTNSPGGSRDPRLVEGYGLLTPGWDAPSNPSMLATLASVQGPPRYAQNHDE
jgi:aryl-phospho-beta-D-glucosidase BglC (GH1 family)